MNKELSATNLQQTTANFDLKRVRTWIFDIDNTLYPAECDLFTQIHQKMAEFIANTLGVSVEQAKEIRRQFFLKYGTTMRGMMEVHHTNPDDYLSYVHNIDYSPIKQDTALRQLLLGLPGRKLVFTNASTNHAKRCAENLGVADLFDGWFDIRDADFHPKPHISTYETFSKAFDINPSETIFFEDTLKNLEPAKQLGWQTAYIDPSITSYELGTPPLFTQVGYVDAHGSGLHAFFDAHWPKQHEH